MDLLTKDALLKITTTFIKITQYPYIFDYSVTLIFNQCFPWNLIPAFFSVIPICLVLQLASAIELWISVVFTPFLLKSYIFSRILHSLFSFFTIPPLRIVSNNFNSHFHPEFQIFISTKGTSSNASEPWPNICPTDTSKSTYPWKNCFKK